MSFAQDAMVTKGVLSADGTKKGGMAGSDAGTSNAKIMGIARRENTWSNRENGNKDFYVDRSCCDKNE